jgi:hypothetical protein
VTAFDEINRKHRFFIETTEREELALWFNGVADTMGLDHEGDVTEEWRTDW